MIIFSVIAIAVISLLVQHLPSESDDQDKVIDRFLFAVMASLMGAMLIWLQKAYSDKYLANSFQALIFIMIPFTSLIELFGNLKYFWFIIPLYFGCICFWFVITDVFIVGGRRNNDGVIQRDYEQKRTIKVSLTLFSLLMGLSLFIFYVYFALIVPRLTNPN